LGRRRFVYVVVENRPIRGDERYSVPGVPGAPDPHNTGEGEAVPEVLYPVVLKTKAGEQLTIGAIGPQRDGSWAWYALFGDAENYLRGKRSAEAAVRELIHLASGLKRKGRVGFHKGVPVLDNTPAVP
jgi:hypothetical protein